MNLKKRYPEMTPKFLITKMDAARRQLETAIHLYFQNGDCISIHTLACAAHGIVCAINKSRGKPSMLGDFSWIKPERRQELIKIMNKPQNFFKHGSCDPNEILDFRPAITESMLLSAVIQYREITGDNPALMNFFLLWTWLIMPECFNLPHEMKKNTSDLKNSFPLTDRARFYTELFPKLSRLPIATPAQVLKNMSNP